MIETVFVMDATYEVIFSVLADSNVLVCGTIAIRGTVIYRNLEHKPVE